MKYFAKSFSTNFLNNNGCVFALLFGSAFACYTSMLNGSFKMVDDPTLIVHNPDILQFSHIGKIFSSSLFSGGSYYRPVLIFYYAVVYHCFGPNPFFFNLINLLLHTAVSISIFILVSHVINSRQIGFFTALLFLVHPIHWEVVSMNLTDTILYGLFYVNAFYFFWRSAQKHYSPYNIFISLILFFLALLSKENALSLPVVIFSYCFLVQNKGVNKKNKFFISLKETLPYLFVLLAYLLLRHALGITKVFYWTSFKDIILAFVMFFKFLLINLQLIFFPVGLRFFRIEPIFLNFNNIEILNVVVLFISLCYLLMKVRKRLGSNSVFFLFWFILSLLPSSQIIPIGVQPGYVSMAERQMYISSLGIIAFVILCFEACYRWLISQKIISKIGVIYAAGGWFLFLVLTTVSQSILASNKMTIYQQSLNYNPKNILVRYALGLEYAQRQLFLYAEKEFRIILAFYPQNVRVRIALGKALCDQGRYQEGIGEYEKVHDAGGLSALLGDNLQKARQLLEKQKKEGNKI